MANRQETLKLDTYQALVSTFSDFLIVAIHTILYERDIYPQTTFISTRKYNCPVRQNRHPKVCKWITDAVAAVELELSKGAVARVAVIIYSRDSQPLERFMFDVSKFPSVPVAEITTPFEPLEDADAKAGHTSPLDVSLVDIEEQFRAVMTKLSVCGSSLEKLPDGCSFTVCIELRDQAKPPLGHPQPWIPTQPSLQASSRTSKHMGSDLGGARTTPLRAVDAGEFRFECWIEEGKSKVRPEESPL
ncbi:MAG: hypothetical protein M1824_003491 [Vezdaea acicularis]|nr:MAG: hypothetical protein M1824_003491 [Vezdaea acicularis]